MTPAERVRRVIAAGNDLSHDDALRDAITESTGLSRPGVDRAFERHLEREVSDDDLAKLLTHAGTADAVTVVLSANVFVGALRAIALALAASTDVAVRPSRRDPAFAFALASKLGLPRLTELDAVTRGEIHVYGQDETIAEIRAKAKVPVRGHGAGMGIAVLSAGADLEASALALADDVVAFDQRGCLSPRIVFAPVAQADAFANALHEALEASPIPRGALSSDERAASARYLSTLTYAGRVLVGREHAIGVATALVAAPAFRHVHIVATDDAASFLAPIARAVTTVGSDDIHVAGRLAPTWARVAKLGEMQRPPLDGPVDLRTA